MKSRHLTTTIFLVLQGCFAFGLVGPIGIPSGYLSGYVITPLFCWKISLKEQKKLTCTLPLRDQYFSNLSIDICDDRKSQGLIKNRFSQIKTFTERDQVSQNNFVLPPFLQSCPIKSVHCRNQLVQCWNYCGARNF